MSEQDPEEAVQTCPLCNCEGFYRKVWNSDPNESVRSDATVCSRKIEGMKGREVWVHV